MSTIVETFDLGSIRAIQRRNIAPGRAIAAVGAVVIGSIDVVVVVTNHGLSLSAPLLLVQMAVSFVFVGFLAWAALGFLDAGPVRLVLTSDGMAFEIPSRKSRVYRWDDPSLDLTVLDFTVVRTTKPRLRPYYPFELREKGIGAFSPIFLTTEAGTAILREARAHNLSLSERGVTSYQSAENLTPNETRIQGREAASRSRSRTGVPM